MPLIVNGLKSGFFIALIAMPLSLGIAIASLTPPIAGIITAIIGGFILSFIGGCQFSIKGPAAGLIVVVMGAVLELGAGDLASGYRQFLAVGVVAAILQIIFALFKTARFGRLMPPSIIHGMLAAIGIIIIAKQIHFLVGATPHGKSTIALIKEIPISILNVNPELAFIGIFTLACLILLPMIPSRLFKAIPPALLALFIVVPLGIWWHLEVPHSYKLLEHSYQVGPNYLVNIPTDLFSSFTFPDFNALKNPLAYKYILMLALIGSIESVLTVIAVDSITKSKSDLNRDLLSVGVGNLICASVGGLPMISEVVRSKANIDNGAKSHWSNFFHGLIILVAVVWASALIREIPLAALAAMLIVTGIRLASPQTFSKIYKIGPDQLLFFVTTLVVTLFSDLLIGIIAGLTMKFFVHLFRGVKITQLFSVNLVQEHKDQKTILKIRGPLIFSNYYSLQKNITNELKNNKEVIVDFTEAKLIDHTVLAFLSSLQDENGHTLSLIGFERLKRISEHPHSTRRLA